MPDVAAVGLSVIRARAAPIAVVLRQGPTKQVRMIRWRLDTDDFERGQWLAGRVYPERCDVSPDGRFFVYFAMRRGHTWNAISRPPHFTPLAVWEEPGTWGGGGVWVSKTELHLRANPALMPLDPKYTLPSWLQLGWHTTAFERDGWAPLDPSENAGPLHGAKPHVTLSGFELQRRPAPAIDAGASSDRHAFAFRIVDTKRSRTHELGTADWADWHPSGDVAIARDGTIVRIAITHRDLGEPSTIADFRADRFDRVPPSPSASLW